MRLLTGLAAAALLAAALGCNEPKQPNAPASQPPGNVNQAPAPPALPHTLPPPPVLPPPE